MYNYATALSLRRKELSGCPRGRPHSRPYGACLSFFTMGTPSLKVLFSCGNYHSAKLLTATDRYPFVVKFTKGFAGKLRKLSRGRGEVQVPALLFSSVPLMRQLYLPPRPAARVLHELEVRRLPGVEYHKLLVRITVRPRSVTPILLIARYCVTRCSRMRSKSSCCSPKEKNSVAIPASRSRR